MEQPNSKPAPDVYLSAAEFLGADPAEAAVIEDSPTGVIAGAAARSHVLGFCPDSPVHQSPDTLLAAGAAEPSAPMDRPPGVLAVGRARAACTLRRTGRIVESTMRCIGQTRTNCPEKQVCPRRNRIVTLSDSIPRWNGSTHSHRRQGR